MTRALVIGFLSIAALGLIGVQAAFTFAPMRDYPVQGFERPSP